MRAHYCRAASVVLLITALTGPLVTAPVSGAATAEGCGSLGTSAAWKGKLSSAGYTPRAGGIEGLYQWKSGPVSLLLSTCWEGEPRTQFTVEVQGAKVGSPEELDRLTPGMVRVAQEALRGEAASVAFQYIEKAESTEPAALLKAMIQWADAASWLKLGEDPRPQPLQGFSEWLIYGTRHSGEPAELFLGVARGSLR
jgi:hypothetical protein